jgi:integrase
LLAHLEKLSDLPMAGFGTRCRTLAFIYKGFASHSDYSMLKNNAKLCNTVYAEFRAKGEAVTRDDAVELRDALYWELGLTTGWRPSSRARINFEDDIHWTGRKGRQIATLTAPKKSEKTGLRRKVELSLSTSQILRAYIDHAVPLLRIAGDDDNPHLFPGRRRGGHISSARLSRRSANLIALRAHVVGATGHKSRHVSVKLHLAENPGDWLTVQEHAGHGHPDTTKNFYANITQVESSKRVQKSLGKR